MTSISQDLRYAARMLLKHKGFTAVATLTLALGIGVNTAMFSVLNTFLFQSLPYPQSSQLVRVLRTSPHSQRWPHSIANFLDQRERNNVFEKMAAYTFVSRNLVEKGQMAERLLGLSATADFFPALNVAPERGRVFQPEEFEPNADNVIVLSDRFWTRRFGGDPNIVGRKVELDGKTVTIVGVMPPGFEHPILWGTVDFWQPMAFNAEQKKSRDTNFLQSFGRLKPGVTLEQAQQSMAGLVANIGKENDSNAGESVRLEPLQRSMSDDIGRKVMWFTFGLAGFVLLIACANLANLQLVRTASNARELAVRAALGASRLRLMRQSLTESVLVALIGGLLSLVMALLGVKFISSYLFANLPGATIGLDLKVFGFALLCSLLTGVLFGTVPALLAARADINHALRESSRGSTASRSQHRLRHTLIIGEVAFAMILLAAAGLFLRGLQKFLNADPGWRPDGLVTAQMSLRGDKYETDKQRVTFLSQLEDRLKSLPEAQQVAIGSSQPVFGFNSSSAFIVEGQPEPARDQYPEMFYEPVSNQYFETYGVRLLRGRVFNNSDREDTTKVIIVNETVARHFWPNEDAIGKRIANPGKKKVWVEIVGIVNDMAFPGGLNEPYTRYQAFVPLTQSGPGYLTIALRTATNPEAVGKNLQKVVAEIDPSLPIYRVRTARQAIDIGLGDISLLGRLLGAFAALGLILSAIGIYGVISYTVVQRTGEFGIRLALGAQRRNVLWLVLRRGSLLIVAGTLLGVAGAYAVGKLLSATVPSLPTRDPIAIVIISVALFVVALLACYIPARRATKVDPLVALRSE